MKKRRNKIFNFYKIAEECSINGFEFLYGDMEDSRKLIQEIIKNLNKIKPNYKEYFVKHNILKIKKKVFDTLFAGTETEEEYKKLLFCVIYYLKEDEKGTLSKVLDYKKADHYESNKKLIDIAKKLRGDDMSIEEFVKNHDDQMIEKGCYGMTLDESRGKQAKGKSDDEAKKKRKEKKDQQAAVGGATVQREQIQEEGRKNRQERKERVDREIAERDRLAEEKLIKEQENLERTVQEMKNSFSQKTIDEQMGLNSNPSLDEDLQETKRILNSLDTNTSDPKKKEKIEELKGTVEEIEGAYAPYRQRSRTQSSGFFSSAIRRKMRLLKK